MADFIRPTFAVYNAAPKVENLSMKIPRLPHVVAALITLVAPLAALAQGTNGSVTTAPLPTAPTMGIPVLILLAALLTGVAAYFLRRAAGRAIAVVAFVAVLTALAGIGYARIMMIMVQGSQCAMQTTQMFMPMNPTSLKSDCPNPIQIISIQPEMLCNMDTLGSATGVLRPCRVGQILTNGEECILGCVT